jgi:hypothetical protein
MGVHATVVIKLGRPADCICRAAEYPAGTHIRVKVIVVDMARIGTVWQLRLSDQEHR